VTPAGELRCEEVARAIHAYAFGRLTWDDAAPVRHHLRQCAICRSTVDEIGRDAAEFLEAAGLDELPDDLVDLIMEAAPESAKVPGDGR
jgi:anti-sigma factor RsiW